MSPSRAEPQALKEASRSLQAVAAEETEELLCAVGGNRQSDQHAQDEDAHIHRSTSAVSACRGTDTADSDPSTELDNVRLKPVAEHAASVVSGERCTVGLVDM
jgi:hypothetical protein